MHGIKFGEPPAAKRPRFGIPGERAIAQGARQIYRFHAILFRPPSEFAAGSSRGDAPDDPEIGSEHRHLMAPSRQTARQCAHLHRWTALLEEWKVRFRDLQDTHCSFKILFNDLANCANWYSRSTRPRPRAPIFLDRKSTRLNSSHGYISY